MSYKNYSVEAVQEIMQKVMEAQKREQKDDFITADGLTLDELIKIGEEIGLDANEIRKAAYEYEHPITINKSVFDNTHIFIEKQFESDLPEGTIWNAIINELGHFFVGESTGKINHQPEKRKWVYVNDADHETVASLTKHGTEAKLKLSQRVGFFGSPAEGVLHGAYISLILFGFIFAIFQPSLALSITVIGILWSLVALILYRLSVSSRKRKLQRLKDLTNRLVDSLPSGSKEVEPPIKLKTENRTRPSEGTETTGSEKIRSKK